MNRSFLLGLFLACINIASAQTHIENPFGHALIPDMVADASIQLIGDTFYCYATTDGYGRGLETSGPPVVWKSKDFVHWSFSGIYFPSAAQQKFWAPSKAIRANGHYYLYPTINGYMYPAVADSPDGPFKLARGEDRFQLPYTSSTLLQTADPSGIDAEVFIDDDGQAYVFWGRRHVAKLEADMVTVDSNIHVISTPRTGYSEGPIFFKRNGIYYYLYTLGGDEHYQYAYVMSRVSPLGPYEIPKEDIVSTTDYETGVFGPGHGCVFNTDNDHYYFAYLEFSRRSTNRQTYVNRLEFNADGTIRPVQLNMDGVGALRKVKQRKAIVPDSVYASSVADPLFIEPMKDERCRRTEYFVPRFAFDGANGSRWMAADGDKEKWLIADLGHKQRIKRSEVYFVRPTDRHVYLLEGSTDGLTWQTCGGSTDVRVCSPHVDEVNGKFRYLRIKITEGVAGVWEWDIY